jgi:multidrug efflux pump
VLARFFIDRPVLAWVISIVIILFGGIAVGLLPIAQYPPVTPPTVRVTATYPGANAQVVADTVAAPIEQQVNGVENMLYMSSQSSNDGSYTLDITFDLGTDVNMAQVLVQNRVAIATPTLPDIVKNIGVVVKKRSPDILLVVNLYSDTDPSTGKPYFDRLYLSNYPTIYLQDALARLDGVGDIFSFGGQDYSMRVWLDPDKLASRNLTAGDVIRVLREQNVQVAAGQVGQPPIPKGQDFQYTLSTLGRLVEAEQFANIIINTGKDEEVTYLRDVGRTELGARNQDQSLTLDGKPSIGLAVFQLPGSNALDVADSIKAKMRELSKRFPKGLQYTIAYDTTPFIRESVAEVFNTLRDAIILVAIVVLLFLQDWKSLLLPIIDVGVSLVGTFAVMGMMGFSLNNLTLFGLVLAIGIVVDDAIVVLENIERWLDKGLPVREATIKAMGEITGPILAITLVLSSVFLPSAFLGGITGQFFRQFALTISASMIISAINAMTMTPARAASIFASREHGPGSQRSEVRGQRSEVGGRRSEVRGQKSEVGGQRSENTALPSHPLTSDFRPPTSGKEALPWWFFGLLGGLATVKLLAPTLGVALGLPAATESEEALPPGLKESLREWGIDLILFLPGALVGGAVGWLVIRWINWALGKFFRGFNWLFDRVTELYGAIVGWGLRLSVIVLLIYVGLLGLTGFGFTRLPTGFIPNQDKGRLFVNVQLPDSAALERTEAVMAKVEKIALETPGIAHIIGNPGRSFVLNAIGSNLGTAFVTFVPFHERRGRGVDAIAAELRARFKREIPEARLNVFGAPAVDGLGNAGGFKLMVEAVGDVDFGDLQDQADNLAAKANQEPGLVGVFNGFRARTPQLYADIDRTKVRSMGIALTDVFDTLQVYLGGYYVNDFNRFGRTWQVNIQADAPFRASAATVKQLKVRNADGDMAPLGAVVDIRDSLGPLTITRYNMFPAATITGASLPGVSTGQVMQIMERLAERELPRNMTFEWTELSYLQKQASRVERFRDLRQNPFSAFVLGAVLVFFVLSGLYESWSLPLAVILVVPMCLLSALIGVALAGSDVNIFVQVGFVVLVGLACKNAILIVEFARDRQLEGASRFDAAVEAAHVRLRPIIMTSFAFILGVLPLVIAEGAGAEMRRSLGSAVFAGMIGVTLFGIFLTPVFYSVVRWFSPAPAVVPAPKKLNEVAEAGRDGAAEEQRKPSPSA